MGIDAVLVDLEAEETSEPTRVISVPGLFQLADLLSQIVAQLHICDAEGDQTHHDAFWDFLDLLGPEDESRFESYCVFARNLGKQMASELGAEGVFGVGAPDFKPEPAHFDAGIRRLLGTTLLNPDPQPPDRAMPVIQALIWIGIKLKRFEDYFTSDEPNEQSAEAMAGANDVLSSVAGLYEESMDAGLSLQFSS